MIVRRNVKTELMENGVVKKTFDLYNDGGCQCLKDCYCYLDKGYVQKNIVTYNNYASIEEALKEVQQTKENKIRLNNQKAEVEEWKKVTNQKEIFKIITQFKHKNKMLKRFNHHEIYDDINKIMQIFFWWKKTK